MKTHRLVAFPREQSQACVLMRWRLGELIGRRSTLRAALASVAGPGAVTAAAALPAGVSTTTAALLYVLAVMGAAAFAGFWAGLAASLLSFLALNVFFTPPFHTLSVGKIEDLVALLVFLVVSATVGALLSSALAERSRAERREREARLLHHLGTRLLAGEPIGDVLRSVAKGVEGLFALDHCEITTELPGEERARGGRGDEDRSEVFPLVAKGREEGRIVIVTDPSRPPLADHEREVIRTLAGQIGLALEGVRLAKDAESARVEADASRARAALFSSISHDLRTPLASITAAVTSLLGEDATFDPGDRSELLETIRQEAERLNRLVGNLLHLSRIRAGGLAPAKTSAAIDEVIEGVVGRLQPALVGHQARLVLRDDLPEIPMDVIQIDQVLTNLLENAAKFSGPGNEITVYAARWQDVVRVRVTDRGQGVPLEERERVFEPFYRAGGDTGPGTGLGLAIARAIVEAHGGRIWIEGAPGGGTAVLFDLPIRE
jgi:two-component system sensor histidine kinase KdpD